MRTLLIVAALAFATGTAFAAEDVMANYYGNTVVGTGGMADTHTYYNPDHTFNMKVPDFGLDFKGAWKIDGQNLCRTFETPPPGVSNPLCSAIAAHNIGDTWTVIVDGQSRTVTLVKGIQ